MKKSNAGFKKKESGVVGGKRLLLKIVTIVVSLLALFLTFVFLNNADSAARDTISVVRIRSNIPANSVITENDVERYDLIRAEYVEKEMILFENVQEEVYGKYSAYFLRGKTVLYKDQLTEEKPLRNEWLYSLSEGEEVVTIPYKFIEAGGSILLPGDVIRIRVTYEADMYDLLGEEVVFHYIDPRSGTVIKTDILFDSIVVKDMLNSNGNSVYELYKEVMRLDDKQRESVMQSKEFLASIKPAALVLAGTAEDMERYAAFNAAIGSGNFLITILSRTSGDDGFDNLPTIETEVRSWIDGGH
ncbi:MAG: flagellar biosynthesis protein FlgA [Oscillospiraceae bacterium]|nr:flagellar biosynthesis protein FlgA [Oscillospiraceae bacterium]